MPQEIGSLSTPEFVAGKVREFIFTDNDGSKRIMVDALAQYLMDQFSYATTAGVSPTTKQAQAQAIAAQLQAAIGREAFMGSPNYPTAAPGGTGAAATAALIDLRTTMYREVMAATDPYREYEQLLATRVKAMFNTMVLPSFPAGVKLIETTRAYIETFVTDRGEESAPSPVSELVTLDQNDSATVVGAAPPAGRFITYRRLYRSATGTNQSAFKLQGEYPIAQTTIVDDKQDEHLNEPCATFGWLPPPEGLQNLTGMANGIHLGNVGRTLYACEPYHPYAYPLKYTKPLEHDITGIVAVGQSAFVGTTGRPYLVSGADSASLSEELISSAVPCASARSMVAIGNSVFYASPDGLALYENGGVTIVTSETIDRNTWATYQPSTMRAGEFDGRYIVFYTKIDGNRGALMFDYRTRTFSELDQNADAVFCDKSGIYVLDGTTIRELMPKAGSARVGSWHSKEFRLARPQAFSWVHVQSTFRNGMSLAPVTIEIYADGELHDTVTVISGEPVRCRGGRARTWRLEIESSARIEGVVMATTTEELKAAL